MTSTQSTTTAPEFITPHDIRSLSDEQIDAMIEVIRANRMAKFFVYQQTVAIKEQARDEKTRAALEKELDKCAKLFAQFDKKLDDLQQSVNKIRAWRLQLGADPL